MRAASILFLTVICAFFLHTAAFAQPSVQNRVDRWNDMWLNQTNTGSLGGWGDWLSDPCDHQIILGCELPGGSGQNYLDMGALWVGAIIVESGFESRRVSVAADSWVNPSITEFWPGTDDSIIERSQLDTVGCAGNPIFSPAAIADHEFAATFSDTLTDQMYVYPDEADGPHRPLGIEVTQTIYSMTSAPCRHVYWIRYHIQNIRSNFLKNLCVGILSAGGVYNAEEGEWVGSNDDLAGFNGNLDVAYRADNDGRPAADSVGNNFSVPNVLGFAVLSPQETSGSRVSFNWWVSNGDTALDYGPAWEDYALRDSLGGAWTATYGTPMGDEHKYRLMRNGERDFDQVRLNDTGWINSHPQDGKRWSTAGIPANAYDVANGYYTRSLLSYGPAGIYDYTDETGRRIYRLNPGESFDVWFACVGGLNFHDPDHPQPNNREINPNLFDFSDLSVRTAAARAGACMDWLPVSPTRPVSPDPLSLSLGTYPNPFNSTATIRFSLPSATRVDVAVYDVLGRQVDRIASAAFTAGEHAVSWDARRFSSGVYFIEARTADHTRALRKALLLK